MRATISNKTNSPKGFYLGHKLQVLKPAESVEGDYSEALLSSLIDTGFDVSESQDTAKKETKKADK